MTLLIDDFYVCKNCGEFERAVMLLIPDNQKKFIYVASLEEDHIYYDSGKLFCVGCKSINVLHISSGFERITYLVKERGCSKVTNDMLMEIML